VPERDLPALYAGAGGFVFPSLWEGFGLPVLEAMAAGVPVVASRRGALPEIAGEAALLVEPGVEPLADALGQLLGDPGLRCRLGEAGARRAQAFSWERTARETLAVYRRALGNAG
jgi:alpha-1,3-rhamnosyl/mannosyltransferase